MVTEEVYDTHWVIFEQTGNWTAYNLTSYFHDLFIYLLLYICLSTCLFLPPLYVMFLPLLWDLLLLLLSPSIGLGPCLHSPVVGVPTSYSSLPPLLIERLKVKFLIMRKTWNFKKNKRIASDTPLSHQQTQKEKEGWRPHWSFPTWCGPLLVQCPS